MKNTRFFLHSLIIALMLLTALSSTAFTGPSYPVPEYYDDPTGSGFNIWGG